MKRISQLMTTLVVSLAATAAVHAQVYPHKAITLIVPYAPGADGPGGTRGGRVWPPH